MVHEVLMPKLTDLMGEVTIVRWLKKEGERIKKGEPLCEVETEKATVEISTPFSGILSGILVHEGSKACHKQRICIIT